MESTLKGPRDTRRRKYRTVAGNIVQKFHEMKQALGAPNMARVVGDSTARAVVARWQHGDVSIRGAANDAAQIVVSLSECQSVNQQIDGRRNQSQRTAVGRICVLPPGAPSVTDIRGWADALHIFVPVSLIEVISERNVSRVEHFFDATNLEIQRQACQILVTLDRPEPETELRLETSIVHLARLLGKVPTDKLFLHAKAGLTPAARRRVDDLIASQIREVAAAPLRLSDMAEAACLSVDHFIRMFRNDTGMTPYRYASGRRLERAMSLLARSAVPVGDVAYRTGFSSPSHFVAAFRRHWGVTPASFRDSI